MIEEDLEPPVYLDFGIHVTLQRMNVAPTAERATLEGTLYDLLEDFTDPGQIGTDDGATYLVTGWEVTILEKIDDEEDDSP